MVGYYHRVVALIYQKLLLEIDMHTERKKSGNARKVGRDLAKCQRYKAASRREYNKVRKLRRHLKGCPMDRGAFEVLTVLEHGLLKIRSYTRWSEDEGAVLP